MEELIKAFSSESVIFLIVSFPVMATIFYSLSFPIMEKRKRPEILPRK